MPQPSLGRGHNRGPVTLSLNLALEHPDVQRLIDEIERLRLAARAEAGSAVRRFTDQFADNRRFHPSRLRNCPRDRRLLARVFGNAWHSAIKTRLPQLRRLNRKLSRIVIDWEYQSDEMLAEPPLYDPSEGRPG